MRIRRLIFAALFFLYSPSHSSYAQDGIGVTPPPLPTVKACDYKRQSDGTMKPVCMENGTGIPCSLDSQCAPQNLPRCNYDGRCVVGGSGIPCNRDSVCGVKYCDYSGPNPVCILGGSGSYGSCSSDSECAKPHCVLGSQPKCAVGGAGYICSSDTDCAQRSCYNQNPPLKSFCVYGLDSGDNCNTDTDCNREDLRCSDPAAKEKCSIRYFGLPCSSSTDTNCTKTYCAFNSGTKTYSCVAASEATTNIQCNTSNGDNDCIDAGKKRCQWIKPINSTGYFQCMEGGEGGECKSAADCSEVKRCTWVKGHNQCIKGGSVSGVLCNTKDDCPDKICVINRGDPQCVTNYGGAGASCYTDADCSNLGCKDLYGRGVGTCIRFSGTGMNTCGPEGSPCDLSTASTSPAAPQIPASVQKTLNSPTELYKTIDSNLNTSIKLDKSSPASFVVFGDLNCGMVKREYLDALSSYLDSPASSGFVTFVPFPLIPKESELTISRAYICAAQQHKQAEFLKARYQQQGDVTFELIKPAISKVLDIDQLGRCMSNPATDAELKALMRFAKESLGVYGTPTNFILFHQDSTSEDLSGARNRAEIDLKVTQKTGATAKY